MQGAPLNSILPIVLARSPQEDVITDEAKGVAVAHYRAICADLLPHADGTPASGLLSEVHGVDRFCFDKTGKIRAIASFRQPFCDELVEMPEEPL